MWHTGVVILMLGASLAAGFASGEPATPDFLTYSHNPSWKRFLTDQTDEERHLKRADLLAISAFPCGKKNLYALQYTVTKDGKERDCRHVCIPLRVSVVKNGKGDKVPIGFAEAIQNSHSKQLSKEELENLGRAIRELPAKSVEAPIERLVLVSFQAESHWVTRGYDSAALPQPMRQIYAIIGERFESKRTAP